MGKKRKNYFIISGKRSYYPAWLNEFKRETRKEIMIFDQQTWTKAAENLPNRLKYLKPTIINLGKLDQKLTQVDLESDENIEENLFLSYLWVLGAYELIRTIHQKSQRKGLLKNRRFQLERLKRELAELRVPLAKWERRGQKDSDVFPQGSFLDGTAGWIFGTKEDTREMLAWSVLEFLLSLKFKNKCPKCHSFNTVLFAEDKIWYLRCEDCGKGWGP
jgi:hypothetical protein